MTIVDTTTLRLELASQLLKGQITVWPEKEYERDFAAQNLRAKDFTKEKHLGDTNFRDCDLTGARFDDCELCNTDFSYAKLRRASFRGAEAVAVIMESAFAAWSTWVRAILRDSYLPNCRLIGSSAVECNFEGCDLSYSDFLGSNLEGAKFAGADLSHCDFTCANLRGADFGEANIFQANFAWADLTDSNLNPCDVPSANFLGVKKDGEAVLRWPTWGARAHDARRRFLFASGLAKLIW